MLRAVPAMIFIAASSDPALRSSIFISAISRTWCAGDLADAVFCRVRVLPDSRPAAFLNRTEAGGVFVMNEKLRSLRRP